MESNLEFRIWDIKAKKWISEEQLIGNIKLYYFITAKGEVVRASYEGPIPKVMIMKRELFEVSQYIGRKDSKGVKAFTGDVVRYEGNLVGADKLFVVGSVVIFEGNVYISQNVSERYVFGSAPFTIIGNKWEGIRGAEAGSPIESVCDSTVQQQDKDVLSFKEAKEYYFKVKSIGREALLPKEAREIAKSFDPIFGKIKESALKGKFSTIIHEQFIDECMKFALKEIGYELSRETTFNSVVGAQIHTGNWIISWVEK